MSPMALNYSTVADKEQLRDAPAQEESIVSHFQWMKSFYFELMGWDPATGKPLPGTLKSLGLEKPIPGLEA